MYCLNFIGLLLYPEDGGSLSLQVSVNFYHAAGFHSPEDVRYEVNMAVTIFWHVKSSL
jgi:hypothetical protein